MKIKIITKKVDDLIPYVNNARTHSEEQVSQIASSIKEFGFNNPILLDGDNGVVAGHGRLLAAKKLGMEEVPCIELAHLSGAKKRAYILADNKLALNAGWDYNLLNIELESLMKEDMDLNVIGFSDEELNEILKTSESLINTGGEENKYAPEEDEFINKSGEVYTENSINEIQKNNDNNNGNKSVNYAIYLTFEHKENAEEWLAQNNFKETFKEDKKILILKIE